MLPDPVEYNHAARFLAQYSITKDASDQPLIRQVNDEMRDRTLAKIVWVTDRGFSSEQNRPYLHPLMTARGRSGRQR